MSRLQKNNFICSNVIPLLIVTVSVVSQMTSSRCYHRQVNIYCPPLVGEEDNDAPAASVVQLAVIDTA